LTLEQKENIVRLGHREAGMARFFDGIAQGMAWGMGACMVYVVVSVAPLLAR